MTPQPETYDQLAQGVLKDYLRSAVIIDDQWPEATAEKADSEAEPRETTPKEAETTPEGGAEDELDESPLIDDQLADDFDEGDTTPAEAVEPSSPQNNPDDARLLAELRRSLVREGLLACGFRYTHQERHIAIELARRADIVVLDWHLVDDDGAEALAILEELQKDALRFVCIFTGHGRIPEVRKALEDRLGKASLSQEDSEADLRIGNLVLAIRNKGTLSESDTEFIIEPGNLLREALEGLATNYNGLVQLTLLELTQRHRAQLPAILKRLDRSIDTAVLLEAGDDESPVGQGGAFLAVLIDEWRAHLEQQHADLRILGQKGRRLYGTLLAEHLGKLTETEMEQVLSATGLGSAEILAQEDKRGQIQDWLLDGCKKTGLSVQGFELGKKNLSVAQWGILCAAAETGTEQIDSGLLRLDSLFHQQFEQPKELTQGTLVAAYQPGPEAHDYYLCVTPVCDTERPPKKRSHLFTFVPAQPVISGSLLKSSNKVAAYCVIEHNRNLIRLEFLLKERFALAVADKTFKNGSIQGRMVLGTTTSIAPIELRAIAQLRQEHALSITAAAAADASRVGVNRVELIRL